MDWRKNVFWKWPWALIGALGLLSLVDAFITLEQNLHHALDAWSSVTSALWDFLLGWFFEWINWSAPWWLPDYLTLATILLSATVNGSIAARRTNIFDYTRSSRELVGNIGFATLWPFYIAFILFLLMIALALLPIAKYGRGYSWTEMRARMRRDFSENLKRMPYDFPIFFMVFAGCFLLAAIIIAASYAFIFYGAPSVPPDSPIWT